MNITPTQWRWFLFRLSVRAYSEDRSWWHRRPCAITSRRFKRWAKRKAAREDRQCQK